MARDINKPHAVATAKKVYLQMVKRLKIDSPELKAFQEERQFERKRAKLKETAIKEAAEIQLKARRYTDNILERMAEIAQSEDETITDSARIQAANFVFDRAYGKAAQTNINANMNTDGKPSQITGPALLKRIEAALKRAEEIAGGTGSPPASEERPADVRVGDIDPDGSTKH